MAESEGAGLGAIGWIDLTVEDAGAVRDFYAAVCGWTSSGVGMGDYEDWCMERPDNGEAVAGICHRRGPNADIPEGWMVYVTVDDVEAAAARAVEHGGAVLLGPRAMGGGVVAVIRDPAGAVLALYQAASAAGSEANAGSAEGTGQSV